MVNQSVMWADWDEELLARELTELRQADYDLSFTGFDDQEIGPGSTLLCQGATGVDIIQILPIDSTRVSAIRPPAADQPPCRK